MNRGPIPRSVKAVVVTKEDVGVGAPYVIGVFFNPVLAAAACTGPGRFVLHEVDPNRVYPRGTLLDCRLIDNVTAASIAVKG